jgi:hypothetical protein
MLDLVLGPDASRIDTLPESEVNLTGPQRWVSILLDAILISLNPQAARTEASLSKPSKPNASTSIVSGHSWRAEAIILSRGKSLMKK